LLDTDPRSKLDALMIEREPLYAEIADLTVSTDGRRVQVVAEDVYRALRER
jgi:shikimate kinase